MPIREFLRGGYQTLTESTLVMKHGHPIFTVIPQKKKVEPAKVEGSGTMGASFLSDALIGSRIDE